MKIALLGATGAVGGHFLTKALAAGHEVTALVRNPDKLTEREGLIAVKGDATNVKGPNGWVKIMESAANAVLSAASTFDPRK